ncbi:hypothetical protein CPB83DRAFT_360183 [Crepidotus variabilis]|uniref:Uncharacterized protein n=1 Tax=Crepidotus variabilis TaxID=179855 RepID=A0A9P6JQ20_9AGAR|nr:hypothetical protein CPB83DRAFT_360183 [Crepidotus variabilis]
MSSVGSLQVGNSTRRRVFLASYCQKHSANGCIACTKLAQAQQKVENASNLLTLLWCSTLRRCQNRSLLVYD